MIEIKALNCYYNGQLTVKNINLNIEQGEMISLVGPSGCGKTTLLKSICGLQEEVEGEILINDTNVMKEASHKRSAIMVFQEYLLYPHLNVVENISFGLKMRGIKKALRHEKVKPFVEKMGLAGLERRYPNELSGGQKQRVALARALAVEPKVLLLDEPFSNLDEQLRDDMRRFVCDLQAELGITTIFVTHDIEEALMSSSRVVVMLEGEIQQIDTPEVLYRRPHNYKVAKMLGTRSFITGIVASDYFSWNGDKIPCSDIGSGIYKKEGEAYAVLTPEAISLKITEDLNTAYDIKKVVFGGSKYMVTLEKDEHMLEIVLLPPQRLTEGDRVKMTIDWSHVQLVEL